MNVFFFQLISLCLYTVIFVRIRDPLVEDSGMYYCIARNNVGLSERSNMINITVIYRPGMHPLCPKMCHVKNRVR